MERHGLSEHQKDLFNYDLEIRKLGKQNFLSPLAKNQMVPEKEGVLAFIDKGVVRSIMDSDKEVPAFEKAGPREKLFFDPGETVSAIVTCGGICPGLNAVIRGIVVMNHYRYNNQRTLGIKYGYAGLVKEKGFKFFI